MASTTAWVRHWPGRSCALPCRLCRAGSRDCGSPIQRPTSGCGPPALSTAWTPCLWHGDRPGATRRCGRQVEVEAQVLDDRGLVVAVLSLASVRVPDVVHPTDACAEQSPAERGDLK